MNLLYLIYNLFTTTLLLFGIIPFLLYTRLTGKYGRNWRERLGYIGSTSARFPKKTVRIWFHAVSLGEVRVADSIIKAVKNSVPDSTIILSTTTEHGRKLAEETLDKDIPIIYGPIDHILAVRRSLSSLRPDVIVFLETEIWPVWIMEAHRMGIKIVLVNGRISKRSYKYYIRLRTFFRYILQRIDDFSMITEEDKSRLISMGADLRKTDVNGNAKYDLLSEMTDPSIELTLRNALNLDKSCPVFIAGSTRTGEEEMILKAYELILNRVPDMVLLIAPRHIERSDEIASLIEKHDFKYQLRDKIDGSANPRSAQVVIINTFGELFGLYGTATLIFCGASLVPLGGQNPLEAAVWGKAVFYGPHMDDFLDAKELLEKNNAGIQVSTPEELADKVIHLMENPDILEQYGTRARQAVLGNRKAAERHARIILKHVY